MTKLVGIAGKARSGKDTLVRFLWTRYGFRRLAFADPVKAAAQLMFGLSNQEAWDDEFKETVIPYWGKSPRQMFQLLGTECTKPHFGDDIWIKRLKMAYDLLKNTDDIVIPDVRFEAEATWIREQGGTIIHLIRDDAPAVNAHISEAGVVRQYGDIVLHNNATLDELFVKAGKIVEEVL